MLLFSVMFSLRVHIPNTHKKKKKNCICTTKMVGWTAVNAKEAILRKEVHPLLVHLHALLLFQGVVMPQLTFVVIQCLCTVVIVVYTAVMCIFVHRGSVVTLAMHCICCIFICNFSTCGHVAQVSAHWCTTLHCMQSVEACTATHIASKGSKAVVAQAGLVVLDTFLMSISNGIGSIEHNC